MISTGTIKLGKKYEVKPKEFHRNLVGTAKAVLENGIIFDIEYCDICDREKVASNKQILVADHDIKQAVAGNCFFS